MVTERREVQPFVWSMALFLISYVGLAISVWPYVVPPHITDLDAASPPESQVFLLIGMMFLIPTILAYTAFSYWVFRGKVTRRDRLSELVPGNETGGVMRVPLL